MEILKYAYEGEGLTRVFENEKWMVGIKNWKPANDIANLDNVERHNITDELFILLSALQIPLLRLSPVEDSLEDVFLRATMDETA